MKARYQGRGALLGLVAIVVLQAACQPSAEQRRGEIYELSADPTPENIERIRKLLDDPDRDIRATALNKLVGLEVPDAEELALAGLNDPDGFVRSIAAKRLGDLGDRDNAGLLVRVLTDDPDPRARQTAAQALEEIGGDVAADGLAVGLDDPMKDVRLASVRAIRKVDPSRATEALARLLLEDSIEDVRVQAAGALGASGNTAMIPILEAALADDSLFVRTAASNALARLRSSADGTGGAGGAAEPSD